MSSLTLDTFEHMFDTGWVEDERPIPLPVQQALTAARGAALAARSADQQLYAALRGLADAAAHTALGPRGLDRLAEEVLLLETPRSRAAAWVRPRPWPRG